MLVKENIVATHRYHWSTEEKVILGILAIAPPAVTALVYTLNTTEEARGALGALIALWVVCLVAFAGLYKLGSGRKNRSKLTVYQDGTRFTVVGNGMKATNFGDLSKVTKVDARKIGINDTFMFSCRSDDGPDKFKILSVPLRVAQNSYLKPHLLAVMENDKKLTPAAKELKSKLQ